MKKYILLILLIPTVLADIEITEVLYDPINTETGGEAILLHNPTTQPINISNYIIKTETSTTDATLPSKILLPGKFFLLTDLNWSNLKDNSTFQDADYEEAITLTNTNAGIALLNANNEIIDAIGWGDPTQITIGLFQGTPAIQVKEGNSLKRISSTNNNFNDFTESYPFQSTESKQEQNQLQLNAHVSSSTQINSLLIQDEDLMTPEIQIFPEPKQQKIIQVSTNITGNPINTMAFLIKDQQILATINLTKNNEIYEGYLPINFYDAPGNYTIKIQADTKIREEQFTYLPLIAIELDINNLNFEVIKGKTTRLDGDQDTTTNKTTIKNIGNTNINLGLSATNFISSTSEIAINNLNYSLDSFIIEKPLSTQLEFTTLTFKAGENSLLPLSFKMYTPETTLEGDYTSTISVTGVVA
ncbi:MAG TPA: lamin tail domain-containing protein [Candidatus Nanoarchaeia archaeon]|nr:lamin tail domain-containing protein [Candidatus Nanoarchaeia archaeon]